eukprot:405514-Prorocentrum_minimum.AAC.1
MKRASLVPRVKERVSEADPCRPIRLARFIRRLMTQSERFCSPASSDGREAARPREAEGVSGADLRHPIRFARSIRRSRGGREAAGTHEAEGVSGGGLERG